MPHIRPLVTLPAAFLLAFLAADPSFADGPATPGAAPPADFVSTLQLQAERKFTANDIKSFVHRIFSMYERATTGAQRVPAQAFRQLLDERVAIDFPDYKIAGWDDFVEWHRWIHEQIIGDDHEIHTIAVEFLEDGRYRAAFEVRWRAAFKDGRYVDVLVEQVWTLREQADRDLPVIETYVARVADGSERTGKN